LIVRLTPGADLEFAGTSRLDTGRSSGRHEKKKGQRSEVSSVHAFLADFAIRREPQYAAEKAFCGLEKATLRHREHHRACNINSLRSALVSVLESLTLFFEGADLSRLRPLEPHGSDA